MGGCVRRSRAAAFPGGPMPPHSASDYDTARARVLADVERLAAAELLVPADRTSAGGGPAAAAAGRRLRLAVPWERAAEPPPPPPPPPPSLYLPQSHGTGAGLTRGGRPGTSSGCGDPTSQT